MRLAFALQILIFSTVPISTAALGFENEALLVERLQMACPKAEMITLKGDTITYEYDLGESTREIDACLQWAVIDHVANPWPVNMGNVVEAKEVIVTKDKIILR